MAGEIASAFVKIRPNMSGFKEAVHSGVGSTLAGLTKAVGVGAAVAGFAALAETIHIGIDEWVQTTKVAAQTDAVLKSTAESAHVTAGHVDELGKSLMNKSGVDDEAIKSGENMLLTFTNIRNEAGKGNDIFDQTTKAVLDMDTAMTHGNVTAESLSHTSILVGKALNDPIKGATALRRVGVTLDEQQQKMIKTLVKSGDTLGAQKIVLGELNKEFGGSAEAMGKTLPGQISILRENFRNLAGELVGKLVPVLTNIVSWTTEHWPEISAVVDAVGNALKAIIEGVVVPVFHMIIDVGETVVAAVKAHWAEITAAVQTGVDIFKAVVGAVVDFGGKYQNVLLPLAGAIGAIVIAVKAWQIATEAWSAVTKIATGVQAAFDVVLSANPIGIVVLAIAGLVGALVVLYTRSQTARDIIDGVFSGIRETVSTVVSFLTGLWNRFGGDILAVVKSYWNLAKAEIQTVINVIRDVIQIFIDLIHGRWGKLWSDVKQLVSDALHGAVAILEGFVGVFMAGAGKLGLALLNGILEGLGKLGSSVFGLLDGLGAVIAGVAQEAYTWALQLGESLVSGVLDGLKQLASKAAGAVKSGLNFLKHPHLWSTPQELTRDGLGKPLAAGVVEGFLLGIRELPSTVKTKIRDALQSAKTAVQGAQSGLVAAFQQLGQRSIQAFDAATTSHLNQMASAFAAKLKRLVTDPMNQAIRDVESRASFFSDQIDAAQAALTPAEQKLADLQAAHDEAQRQAALSSAQGQLATADTPEAVAAAQQAIEDARYQITIAGLQKEADSQRKVADRQAKEAHDALSVWVQQQEDAIKEHYDVVQAGLQAEYDQQVLNYQSQRDLQKSHLDELLSALSDELAKHPAEWKSKHAELMALFKDSFGPDYKTAGANLGSGFAQGIRESFSEVGTAVRELAALVAKYLKVESPTALGPMSDLDRWWTHLPATLAGALRPGSLTAALTSGLALGPAGARGALGAMDASSSVLGVALSPLGTLVDLNARILEELQRQTNIAADGQNVAVTVTGGAGASLNDIARQALR